MSAPDLQVASHLEWDAVIVGGGIAGLSAAWEFTRAGLRPLVLEARGYPGGQIASLEVGGARVDIGAESFAPRGDAVSSMADALGLEIETPGGGRPRLFLPPLPDAPTSGSARGWALHPFVPGALMGIPSDLSLPELASVLGTWGAGRAALDASLGREVGARAADLASLVEARMGRAVLDRLVRPIVAGILSTDPARLDVDRAVPGLRDAFVERGSLSAAVAALLARAPGPRGDVGLRGGMRALVAALESAIDEAGGAVLTRAGARALVRRGGSWILEVAPTRPAEIPSDEPVPSGPSVVVRAPRLVIACSPGASRRLLEGLGPDLVPSLHSADGVLALPAGAPIVRSFLAVRAEGLDSAPVGPGLLVAPDAGCPVRAKALSQLDVKWSGIAESLEAAHGPHVHLLRLSHGRIGESDRTPRLPELLADASALTGVPLGESDVLDHRVVHWNGTLAQAGPELRARIDAVRAESESAGGLALAGAWVAGSGVSRVVADARERARRLA